MLAKPVFGGSFLYSWPKQLSLTEFDSAVIYLALYFRFSKKQLGELWHEGQGHAHWVNEPDAFVSLCHYTVFSPIRSNCYFSLSCKNTNLFWVDESIIEKCCAAGPHCSRLLSQQCWTILLNYVSRPKLFNPILIKPEQSNISCHVTTCQQTYLTK